MGIDTTFLNKINGIYDKPTVNTLLNSDQKSLQQMSFCLI